MNTLSRALSVGLILVTLAACDQMAGPPSLTPTELIVGKWQFEKLDIPKAELDRLERRERAEVAQLQLQFKVMRYSFFNDGTYSLDAELSDDLSENMERGNYRLINDGAVLVTEPTQESGKKNKTSELHVMRLSSDTLLINEKKDKAGMLFLRDK